MIEIRQKEHLVHLKSKDGKWQDRTSSIDWIEKEGQITKVKFKKANLAYTYGCEKVKFETNPKLLDISNVLIEDDGKVMKNIAEAYAFKNHIVLYMHNGYRLVREKNKVKILKSCLNDVKIKSVLDYQKELAGYLEGKDGEQPFLQKELQRISFLSSESALASYLRLDNNSKSSQEELFIYPFGINESQKKAVETSFNNKISVIQGPPGTGKTQTILNIIANVIYRKQSVAVVSGNNSATSNVYEKLVKAGYGFLAAPLGNKKNIESFFSDDQVLDDKIDHWMGTDHIIEQDSKMALEELEQLNRQLTLLNKKQQLCDKRAQLRTEQNHYLNRKNVKPINLKDFVLFGTWSSKQILKFILDLELLEVKNTEVTIIDRIKLFIKYKFIKFRISLDELIRLVPAIQVHYYVKALEECSEEIKAIEQNLKNKKFDELMKLFNQHSHNLMKYMIYKRREKAEHLTFDVKSYKLSFNAFIKKYPIILSTTHSIRRCIPENFLFDVLIIDEASQVDLITATIAMSCCKRLVIVGDPMQLPHVVTNRMDKANSYLLDKYEIADEFNYAQHSIIDSLRHLYKSELPVTLLKEHYRCHPQIIRFCNQKYYNDELIIMTKEQRDDCRLKLVKTVEGNHERRVLDGGWINQRQLEVIRDELLPQIEYEDNEIGVVTPYRKQAELGKQLIKRNDILIETVHKFQGREKDSIIISTVKKATDNFNDDKRLINVAVSRAVQELNVVINSNFEAVHGSHIGDLVKYIEYVAGDAGIYESSKVSIFDCLYQEYSKLLLPIINQMQHISEFKSENLMYTLVNKILKEYERFNSLNVVVHFPLHFLIHNQSELNAREYAYVNHPFTHVDFVVFNKLNKEPVLIIEVDGYSYHDLNQVQMERDKIKDKVLKDAGYKLQRFSTIGSNEEERLIRGLDDVVCK